MIFFTADTHFNHYNIIKYCNRPFESADEMNKEIINRWNEKVSKSDTVYHLGDLSMGRCDDIFEQLRGHVYFIPGNHDRLNVYKNFDPTRFRILPSLTELKLYGDGYPLIVCCHYPLASWNRSIHGSWNLYGHCHGTYNSDFLQLDVGVDSNNFYPLSIEEINEIMNTKKEMNDGKEKQRIEQNSSSTNETM